MLNISLEASETDFKSLEKIIFNFVCKLGCLIFKWSLMSLDRKLMEGRDKKAYRHKGKKKACIKTVMGPVEFRRAIYEHVSEKGEKEFIFLLDKYIKLETIGFMSPNLIEKVVENASDVSFRKAARNVTELTGQEISHGAVWNVVQELGKRISEEEKEKVEDYKAGKLNGKPIEKMKIMRLRRQTARVVRTGLKAMNASGKAAYQKMTPKQKKRYDAIFFTVLAVIVWIIIIKFMF